MIILIVLQVCFAKDIGALFDSIISTEFGNSTLKQLQLVVQSTKNSPMDLVLAINSIEESLFDNIFSDMKAYQEEQTRNIELKQELKHQIMLTKFTQQLINDELNMLQNEVKLVDDIRQQRLELLGDHQQLIPLLDSIRKDEVSVSITQEAQYDLSSPELRVTLEIFSEITQLLKPEEVQLTGQQNHKKNKKQTTPAEQLSYIKTQALRNFHEQNPYIFIINQLNNDSQFEQLLQISSDIEQYTGHSIQIMEELNQQRIKIHNSLKEQLSQDSDKWKQDISAIEPVGKITREKLISLSKSSEDLKQIFSLQTSKFNEVQENNDNLYTNYSSKRLADISNLGLVRTIKQALSEQPEVFEDFLKNKYTLI